MGNPQLTHLYIETNWTQFPTPYYDDTEDLVYYTAHTELTTLQKTWELVFDANRQAAFDFFKKKGYFTVEVQEPISLKLPITAKDANCPVPGATGKTSEKLPALGKLIFENYKKTIDLRPEGTISLLYIVKNASEKNINVKKVQDDFKTWLQTRPKPPISNTPERKDFSINLGDKGLVGKCVGVVKQKDGSIKEGNCAGSGEPCKSNSQCAANLKDFAKIKNIGSVTDLNHFLQAMVKESEQLRMSALSSHALGGDPGDMGLVGSVQENAKVLGTGAVRENIVNESLSSVEYISDYALLSVPYMFQQVGEGTEAFGGNETAKALAEARAAYKENVDWLFAQANKWGLTGLVECSLAHIIQEIEGAQGITDTVIAMMEELKLATATYKAVGAEFAQYKNIVKLAKQRFKSGQGWKDDFGEKIHAQVKVALEEIVKQLINLMTQYCLKKLTEPTEEPDYGWGTLAPEQVFNDPDIPAGALAALDPAAADTAKIKKELDDFIKEVFAQLTPKELCALMQGTSTLLITMLYKKIQKFGSLKTAFPDEQSVANYFYKMGKLSGTEFCKTVGTQKYETVEYCGLKIKEPLKKAYEEKVGDQLPDFPSISLDDLKSLIDDDMVEDALPPFNYNLILEPSYKVAQQDLISYKKIFDKDITSAFSPESQTALSTTSNKANMDASSKGLDLDSDDEKELNNAKAGNKNPNYAGVLGDGASALKNPITVDKMPPFPKGIVKSPTVSIVSAAGADWWTIEGLLEGSVLGSDGKIDVQGYMATITNKNQFTSGLPTTGIEVTSNNNVSPLTIIGDTIPETPYETSQKGLTKPFETRQLTAGLSVADLYTDILFKVLSGYINSLSAVTATVDYASKLDFDRIKRRARVLSILCAAENEAAKGNETAAQAYITDDSIAMDIESLRIFTYLLLVENYPNLIVTLLSLPPSAVKFGEIKAVLVTAIIAKFEEIVDNSGVTIPVKNLMCAANLTVIDLIEEEIKFLKSLSSSGTGSPSIKATLKDTLAITYENASSISFNASNALKTYFKNWLGFPSKWQDLLKPDNWITPPVMSKITSHIMSYREQLFPDTYMENTLISKDDIGTAPWHYDDRPGITAKMLWESPLKESKWAKFPYDTIEDIIEDVFVGVYGSNWIAEKDNPKGKPNYFGQIKGNNNYKNDIWKEVQGFYKWVGTETFPTSVNADNPTTYYFKGKDFAQTLMMVLAVFRVLWHMNYNAHKWLTSVKADFTPRIPLKDPFATNYIGAHHQTYEDAVKGIFFGGDDVYQPGKTNPTPWGVNVSDVALQYTTQFINKGTKINLTKALDPYVAPLDFNKEGWGSIMWWVTDFGKHHGHTDKMIPEPEIGGYDIKTLKGLMQYFTGLIWSIPENAIIPKLGTNAKVFLETSSTWGQGVDWTDVVGKVITKPAPSKIDNPILNAFNPNFIATLLAYFTRAYAFTPKKNQEVFFELKPAIMNRFIPGASGIPVGVDLDQAKSAGAALSKINKMTPLGMLTELGMPMWLLIIMFVPKLIFGIIKGVLMSALYFSNPVVYAILMMAESLGLSLPEFFDWLDEKTRREILASLDPESPEAKSLQGKLDTGSGNAKSPPISSYECKILP